MFVNYLDHSLVHGGEDRALVALEYPLSVSREPELLLYPTGDIFAEEDEGLDKTVAFFVVIHK